MLSDSCISTVCTLTFFLTEYSRLVLIDDVILIYITRLYIIKQQQLWLSWHLFVKFVTGRWFSLGTPVSSTNKTDCHNIAEILSKVALQTINLNSLDVSFFLQNYCDEGRDRYEDLHNVIMYFMSPLPIICSIRDSLWYLQNHSVRRRKKKEGKIETAKLLIILK